jgi:hypothetical protein
MDCFPFEAVPEKNDIKGYDENEDYDNPHDHSCINGDGAITVI